MHDAVVYTALFSQLINVNRNELGHPGEAVYRVKKNPRLGSTFSQCPDSPLTPGAKLAGIAS